MMTSPVAVVIMIAPCVYRAHCCLFSLLSCLGWKAKQGKLGRGHSLLISHAYTPFLGVPGCTISEIPDPLLRS